MTASAGVFNNKRHSDITITIVGDGPDGDALNAGKTFYLHKFPLVSKSAYFDEIIPDSSQVPGPTEIRLTEFPGGAAAFEIVAKYCYGLEIELTVENIAPVYCACRVLKVAELERSTEAYMTDYVLRDPVKAAIVLRVTAGIAHMTEAMMAGLVGHCINAIAAMFAPIPELNALPPECFVVVVKTARDMNTNKRTLETAVTQYLKVHVSEDTGVKLDVEQFLNVVAAPGRLDDMNHCKDIYNFLETMLKTYKRDEDAETLCKGLHDLGFWVCLHHETIERAYQDRNIPDRYCTVALMAENRFLIKTNEELVQQVESLADALKSRDAASGDGSYLQGPPALGTSHGY